MQVEAPREQRTLFLGDLSIHCTEKDIQTLFRPFGVIESIKIKHGYTHQHHSVYGFIRFATLDSAVRAVECLQGAVLLGRPLRIAWAQRNASKRLFPKDPSEAFQTAQIHFSFISRQIEQIVSELTLRELFGQFGEVLDVAIKKSNIDHFEKVQHGYGFIHYPMSREGILSALRAIKTIHQVTIGPVTYDSTLGISLKEIIDSDPELWEIWQGFRIPPVPLNATTTLPVTAVIPPTLPASVVPAAAPPAVNIIPPQLMPYQPPPGTAMGPGGGPGGGGGGGPMMRGYEGPTGGGPYGSGPSPHGGYSSDLSTYGAPPPAGYSAPHPAAAAPHQTHSYHHSLPLHSYESAAPMSSTAHTQSLSSSHPFPQRDPSHLSSSPVATSSYYSQEPPPHQHHHYQPQSFAAPLMPLTNHLPPPPHQHLSEPAVPPASTYGMENRDVPMSFNTYSSYSPPAPPSVDLSQSTYDTAAAYHHHHNDNKEDPPASPSRPPENQQSRNRI